jgi:hypothetical protein
VVSWPHTPSGAEVKNEWSYNSTPHYIFMACTGATSSSPYLKLIPVYKTSLVLCTLLVHFIENLHNYYSWHKNGRKVFIFILWNQAMNLTDFESEAS